MSMGPTSDPVPEPSSSREDVFQWLLEAFWWDGQSRSTGPGLWALLPAFPQPPAFFVANCSDRLKS